MRASVAMNNLFLFLQDEVASSAVVYVETASTPAHNDPVELTEYISTNAKQTFSLVF